MLAAIRNSLNHWIAKGLFLILAGSFAIWGIGDFVRSTATDRPVATVAGSRISLAEASDAYQRELAQLRRSMGGQFEPTEQVRRAIAEAALGRLVALRAIGAEAAARGVVVTDDALRGAILSAPGFRGADGQFSRVQYESFLRNNGLTEGRFLELLRQDLARAQLVGAVRAGADAPQALARAVEAFHGERRVADLVELPFMAAPAPAEPSDDQLRRFHENNPDQFSAPEYRRFDAVLLSVEDVARSITVTDEELHEAYDQRAAEFSTPERRQVAQALVPNEAAARAIAEAWRGGADLAAITAEAQAAGGSANDLGLVDRGGLPLPELEGPAFAAPANSVTDPVQSPFGWHVLRIGAVEAASTRGFDSVEEELRATLARERAADLIYDRINRIEDSLAEGTSLAEVARRHELRHVEVAAMDAEGRDREGRPVDLGAARGEIITAVFEAPVGETTRLTETRDGTFYALRVAEVIAPALRPFESVRAEVRAAWERAERRRAMEQQAATLVAAVAGGKSLDQAAREAGWSPRRTEPFTRDASGAAALPAQLAAALFALKPGEATMIEGSTGFLVASVAEVLPAPPDGPAIARRRTEVSGALADDLEAQFIQALRDHAEVSINAQAVQTIAGEAP